MLKKYLVTKVPAHHLYRCTDFAPSLNLCVIEILHPSLKAAKHQCFSHHANFFFPTCERASTLKWLSNRLWAVRQSKMTSIFFLTSIFNHSIHSSIAVFYLGPHIHEKSKGRIETWQPRKRQKRRARRNNNSSNQTKGDGVKASPLVFCHRLQPALHKSPALQLISQ